MRYTTRVSSSLVILSTFSFSIKKSSSLIQSAIDHQWLDYAGLIAYTYFARDGTLFL